MWKIKRSSSQPKPRKHTEVFVLQFADKPMYLERVSEDISGGSEPQSVAPSQDIRNQSSPSEQNL
jgi:hypothetical protein